MHIQDTMLVQSFRLFFRGYLIPFLAIYLVFRSYVNANEASVYGFAQAYSKFRLDYATSAKNLEIPDPEVVIIGDSGAKFGISPQAIGLPYSVNLAAIYGNALTGYETMSSYYENRPAPKCVVMVNQYEWRRSHEDFMSNSVERDLFTFAELRDLWKTSAQNGIFPTDKFSFVNFWGHYLLSKLKLTPQVISNLRQPQVLPSLWQNLIYQLNVKRGHVALGDRPVADETEFFRHDINDRFAAGFTPDAAEDLYLIKLAELTAAHGSLLYLGSSPLADSDLARRSLKFQQERARHLRALLGPFPNVRWLELPHTFARVYFYDFTHLNSHGADLLSRHLRWRIVRNCQSRQSFWMRARTAAVKSRLPASKELSPKRYSSPE